MTERPTAFHESGHAVIARALTVRVNFCLLERPPPLVGYTGKTSTGSAYKLATELKAPIRVRLQALTTDLQIIMSGPISEARVRGLLLDDQNSWENEWCIDQQHLQRDISKAAYLSGDRRENIHARILASTDALVEQHWPAIRAVAKALLRDGALNQDQIDALADAALADRPRLS